MKKVLLFNPPFTRLVGLEQDYVPLSLWHISALLKNQHFDPYIKNMNMAKGLHYVDYLERNKKYDNLMSLYDVEKYQYYKELDDIICTIRPDIIGFTVLTPQIKIVNDLIRYIKIQYGIPIFCGGAGATLNYNKIYGCNIIFQAGVDNLSVLKNIDNYKSKTIFDNTFSLNNYDGELNFDNILDTYSPDGYGHVFSSIGCYANCRFCESPAIWKRKVYFKPIQSFVKDLNSIAIKYNPTKFTIWDENFTVGNKHLKAFCNLYKLEQKWSCDSRIDTLNEDKIKLMKKHGCDQINLGVESGCQKTLDYLNKKIKKKQISKTFDLLNNYDIRSKAYLIIGFPDETYKDIIESIEFVKSINPSYITLSLFTPYMNTSLYEECKYRELIDDDYDESNYSHQSGKFIKMTHPDIDILNIIKTIDEFNANHR